MQANTPQDPQEKEQESALIERLEPWFEFKAFDKEFFTKYKFTFLIFLVCSFLYISNRYEGEQKLAEIERLKQELIDKRYEALTRSSELIGISRPSEVQELVKKQGVDLVESNQPAYILK